MSISQLYFPVPIRRRVHVAPRDFARREQAIALFESGDFYGAIADTLAYLLPSTQLRDLREAPLLITQGSARVHVRIEGEQLSVRANLAAPTETSQTVAALRFFLTRLSATGQLFQPRLDELAVYLEFREQIHLLHPQKLIEVMHRLPMEADSHDAWLVEQFGLAMVDRQTPAELDEAEFTQAWRIWSEHWVAVEALMTESRRRRQISVLDSLGSFTINQLVHTLPIFGPVRATLNEYADQFTSRDETAGKRDAELAKCVKQMRQLSPQALRACLGHGDYAINPLHEGTPALLSSVLGGGSRMQKTGEHRAAGRGLEATLELIADFLYLLAHHTWPDPIYAGLRGALDSASEKPWREAADVLWNQANSIAKTFGNHSESSDDEADAGSDDEEYNDRFSTPETAQGANR
jgi:hypothetical protein